MLSQQNLIYLGIALLIVGIAFFAYQELQKHHTEIEKLRMQSQKLEKIIYAYNMRQWHASADPYLNDGAADSDNEEDSNNESGESDSENESGPDTNMSSFIRQTLNSLGTPAGPSKVTISAGGKTVQFPVTPQITNQLNNTVNTQINTQNDEDDIPDVDTFDIEKPQHNNGENNENCLEEMEQNDFDIDESKNQEKGGFCNATIKSGERTGEICGSAAKAKGMCLRHYRQENKIH